MFFPPPPFAPFSGRKRSLENFRHRYSLYTPQTVFPYNQPHGTVERGRESHIVRHPRPPARHCCGQLPLLPLPHGSFFFTFQCAQP